MIQTTSTTSNPIVRQIQIDLITGEYNPLIKWFNQLCDQLLSVKTNVFYKHDNEVIHYLEDIGLFWVLYYDPNNNIYQFDYVTHWDTLVVNFGLTIHDIASITKLLIIENRLGITTDPMYVTMQRTDYIEEALTRHYYAENYKPGPSSIKDGL